MGRLATCSNLMYFQNKNVKIEPIEISLTTVKIISDKVIIFEGKDYTDTKDISQSMAPKCNSFRILDKNNINKRYNEAWIARGLLEGTLRAVCDGSYKPKLNDKGITAA